MKLEDLIKNPTDSIKKRMDQYFETATPEQIVKEFEALGVEFEPISVEQKFVESNLTISNELSAVLNDSINAIETLDNELPEYLLSDPEIVGYPDEDMQHWIYNWVGDDLPIGNISIKDFGAGRGDFYNFLKKNYREDVEYHGIELNPNLCNVAKAKYPDINIINDDYFNVDLNTDCTIIVGTLNTKSGIEDKWDNFNKTLIHAKNTTNHSIIFILARNMEGFDDFLDYPIEELIPRLPSGTRFNIDYSRYEDIYRLTVYISGFN